MDTLKDIRESLLASGNVVAKIGAFFFGLAILFMLLGKTATYILLGVIAVITFGKIKLNKKDYIEPIFKEME